MRPEQAFNPDFGSAFLWRQIRAFKDAEFTTADLHSRVPKLTLDTLRLALAKFVKAGLVRHTGVRRARGHHGGRAKTYLCAAPGAKAPVFDYGATGVRGLRQARLWLNIRTLQQWTLEELALRASTEDVEITASLARGYVWQLQKAGIVLVVVGRRSLGSCAGMAPAVFKLNPRCNFGPTAPQVFRDSGVYDPNHRKWVWKVAAAQVSA